MTSQESTRTIKHRGKGKGWSNAEDQAICRAWLDVSQDPIVSVNQKSDTLYTRILGKFNEICQQEHSPDEFQSRTAQAIKSRWTKINRLVSKFVGCKCTIDHRNESGSSPTDDLKKAMMLYAEKEGHHFNLMHCYELLLDAPKWKMTLAAPTDSEPILPDIDPSVENMDLTRAGSSTRPMGQKRAKFELAHNEALHETLRDIAASSQQMADVCQQKLEDSKKRTAALEQMVNHKIMRIDTDKLTSTARHYYEIIQNRILRSTQAEEQAATHELADLCNSQQSSSSYPETASEGLDLVVYSEEESQVEVVPIEYLRNGQDSVVEENYHVNVASHNLSNEPIHVTVDESEHADLFEREVNATLARKQEVLDRLEISTYDANFDALNFSFSENE